MNNTKLENWHIKGLMRHKYFYINILLLSIFHFWACVGHANKMHEYKTRVDFRFGNRFYSFCSKESGDSYVIKGKSSEYNDSFVIFSADTSRIFRIDPSKVYFGKLTVLSKKPLVVDHHSDAPRVEIYYDGKKIYDSHRWDEEFWDIFRPVMSQLPKGFNPFLIDENPFEVGFNGGGKYPLYLSFLRLHSPIVSHERTFLLDRRYF